MTHPKPVPPMDEPTWFRAVVMADYYGPWLRNARGLWFDCDGEAGEWRTISNPRPLTADERRQYGIPETIPDGWVAVDASALPDHTLRVWASDDWPSDAYPSSFVTPGDVAKIVARAEIARREAQG